MARRHRDGVRRARTGVRRYRDEGNAAGAARMATWLAADELDFHGAAAVAQGWLQRAHRLLDPLEPGPNAAGLRSTRALMPHSAIPRRKRSRSRPPSSPPLPGCGPGDARSRASGAALVARAEVDEGMRCLDEATATALAGDAGIPISSAWTCCMLVTACVNVLDSQRARNGASCRVPVSGTAAATCSASAERIQTVLLWRGRWAEAEALLEASTVDLGRSRPPSVAGPLAELAGNCGGGRARRTRRGSCSSRPAPQRLRSSAMRASPSTPVTR